MADILSFTSQTEVVKAPLISQRDAARLSTALRIASLRHATQRSDHFPFSDRRRATQHLASPRSASHLNAPQRASPQTLLLQRIVQPLDGPPPPAKNFPFFRGASLRIAARLHAPLLAAPQHILVLRIAPRPNSTPHFVTATQR